MEAVHALEQPSLVELTSERLRAEILSGALAPGARVVEEQLCRRYGISRAPLREALRLLAEQGLVEHLPRRGARVSEWSPTDIRQLFEIRHVLERHAVLSALPLAPGNGDPLAPVRERLAAMRAAEERGDQLAKDDARRGFHAAVVGLAGNRQLELTLAPTRAGNGTRRSWRHSSRTSRRPCSTRWTGTGSWPTCRCEGAATHL